MRIVTKHVLYLTGDEEYLEALFLLRTRCDILEKPTVYHESLVATSWLATGSVHEITYWWHYSIGQDRLAGASCPGWLNRGTYWCDGPTTRIVTCSVDLALVPAYLLRSRNIFTLPRCRNIPRLSTGQQRPVKRCFPKHPKAKRVPPAKSYGKHMFLVSDADTFR